MIFVIPIIFIFIILISSFLTSFKNKWFKYLDCSIYILFTLSALQIFNYILIGFSNTNFNVIKIINYVMFFLIFVIFLIYIFYRIYKNKNEFKKCCNKETFLIWIKENIIFLISIVVFVILCIFIRNNYVDLGKYLDISSAFNQNIYLENFNSGYRYCASYYVYACFENNNIGVWYNFFTPFCFYIIMGSIINDAIKNIFNKQNLIFKQLFVFISYCLIYIFFIPGISSGNLFIQASLFAIIFILIYQKKYLSIPLIILSSQFFSITGNLLTLIFCGSLFFYFLFFKKLYFIFKNGYIYLIPLFSCGSFLGLTFSSKVSTIKIIGILFIFLSLLITIFFYLIYKKLIFSKLKNDDDKNKFSLNISETKFIKSKISFIIISTISFLLVILNIVYFIKIYQYKEYYSGIFIAISGIILTSINLWLLYYFFYKKNINKYKILYFGLITLFLSSLIILISIIAKIDNSSFWRIDFSSYCLPLPESISTLLLISFTFVYNIWVNFIKNKISNWSFFKMENKKKKIMLSTIVLPLSICSSIPIIYSQTTKQDIKPELISFNGNISQNLNLFTDNDITMLKSFNQKYNAFSYASDMMVSLYFNYQNTKNLSVDVTQQIWNPYKLTDNRYWTYNRIGFYDCKINNNNFKNVSFEEFLSLFNKYLINNWNVDYLFLNKNSRYFKNLNINKNWIIDESQNIIVLAKK